MDYNKAALEMHREHHGKISVESKVPIKDRDALSTAYTPGVAAPCLEIRDTPDDVWVYTCKSNTVGVVSDGSAVLGLGNIGAAAGIPVMEGKAALFKNFAGIDAFPICLDTQDPEEIIRTVKNIAPVFGGINLEDIGSPRCFEIERRLEEELDIPVFHDDQHGTAIVVAAALSNALKVVGKKLEDVRIVQNGPGAAGNAIIRMLLYMGAKDIIANDKDGIVTRDKEDMYPYLKDLAKVTNPRDVHGGLAEAVRGADVFIGTSVANVLTPEMARSMNRDAVIFAMANPNPEIAYDVAKACGVRVMGTGRSDMPNQVNNVLAFPGVFKGALSVRARDINYEMKLAAVRAIASIIPDEELSETNIIPSLFDERVVPAVSAAVADAARRTGVARL